MTLQPAHEIALECHGHTVTLRASLRAAVTIQNMTGGISNTWEQISRWSYSTIRAVILAAATDRQAAHHMLAEASNRPLKAFLPCAQAACLAVLAALISNEGDDSADDAPSQGSASAGEAITLHKYFQNLYDYATGWMGWTPSETWNASPAEITAAFKAHTDRLLMLTPGLSRDGGEKDAPSKQQYSAETIQQMEDGGLDPNFDRHGLQALKARHGV